MFYIVRVSGKKCPVHFEMLPPVGTVFFVPGPTGEPDDKLKFEVISHEWYLMEMEKDNGDNLTHGFTIVVDTKEVE